MLPIEDCRLIFHWVKIYCRRPLAIYMHRFVVADWLYCMAMRCFSGQLSEPDRAGQGAGQDHPLDRRRGKGGIGSSVVASRCAASDVDGIGICGISVAVQFSALIPPGSTILRR